MNRWQSWLAHAAAATPFELEPRKPVFLVGCARSGTSILKRVIATHTDVVAFPEEANHLWHPTAYPWSQSDHRKPPHWADPVAFTRLSLADWRPGHGAKIRREFGAYQRLRGGAVFLNKSSMIACMLREVRELFPQARFVHIVRDGRSVALSYARKEHTKMEARAGAYRAHGFWFSFEEMLERMAVTWQTQLREIDRVVDSQGWVKDGVYFECRYEDFCRRPRELVEEIVGFLGLDRKRLHFRKQLQIRNMNYKVHEALAPAQIRALSERIGVDLARWGYQGGIDAVSSKSESLRLPETTGPKLVAPDATSS